MLNSSLLQPRLSLSGQQTEPGTKDMVMHIMALRDYDSKTVCRTALTACSGEAAVRSLKWPLARLQTVKFGRSDTDGSHEQHDRRAVSDDQQSVTSEQ